jgi:hypothetical protein
MILPEMGIKKNNPTNIAPAVIIRPVTTPKIINNTFEADIGFCLGKNNFELGILIRNYLAF